MGRRTALSCFLPLLLLASACAPALQLAPEASPEEIPELEARLLEDPQEVPLLVRLGMAYRAADRLEDSRDVLSRAVELEPTRASAAIHLGLTYEAWDRPTAAREVYAQYRDMGDSPEALRWIEGRMTRLRRAELAQAARAALEREAVLADTPPRARHVAVLPFLYTGSDPTYEPLGRAVAELMVTDLARTDRLTVLERMEVQLLLDEMELAEAGRVDPATAARSGRLLGAEHTVLGALDAGDQEVGLDAALVRVVEGDPDAAPVSYRDALQALFELQKQVVLDLYQGLGIELTPGERELILERPTESLDALLAFGRGLVAQDQGDFGAAAQHFREAAQLDPGFQEAATRASESEAAVASGEGPPEVAAEEWAMDSGPDPGELGRLEGLIPDPLVRDAVSEATGQEGFGRRSILELILRRP